MNFFGIGSLELIVIIVVLLIIVGPTRLHEIISTVSKISRKLREATNELTTEFKEMAEEVKDTGKELNGEVSSIARLKEELRDVTGELDSVKKEISTALKSDIESLKDKKNVSAGPDNETGKTDTSLNTAMEKDTTVQDKEVKSQEQE